MALLAKSTGAEAKKTARKTGRAATKRLDRAGRRASRKLDKAASRAGKSAEAALETVGPRIEAAVETAAEWASPRLESAKDVALERAAEAREWAEPRVQTALQQAAEAAGPALEEAKVRGTRAVAALRGEEHIPPPPKRRRGRKVLFVLLGVTAAGAVAYVAWAKRSANGFDYYSLPADDYGRDEHHHEPGSAAETAPLGSVTEDRSPTDPALFGNPASEPTGTPDADATEAAEEKPAKKTGSRRNTRSSS